MSIITLSFSSVCKHCKDETTFNAVSIPEGLPERQIEGILDDRENDCCYPCYERLENIKKYLKVP